MPQLRLSLWQRIHINQRASVGEPLILVLNPQWFEDQLVSPWNGQFRGVFWDEIKKWSGTSPSWLMSLRRFLRKLLAYGTMEPSSQHRLIAAFGTTRQAARRKMELELHCPQAFYNRRILQDLQNIYIYSILTLSYMYLAIPMKLLYISVYALRIWRFRFWNPDVQT